MAAVKASDTFSVHSTTKEGRQAGLETFDAPALGHGIPIIGISGVDPIFEAKSLAINEAIQHMGWGRYQTKLFILSGFGWFVDNMYVSADDCWRNLNTMLMISGSWLLYQ